MPASETDNYAIKPTEESLTMAEKILAAAMGCYSMPEEQTAEWQPGEDPYKFLCITLHNLLLRKSGYYGNPERGPLSNALGVKEDGIEPWRYQLARIGEKCRRLRGSASNDPSLVWDTLLDIAGHAVVALACVRESGKDGR